MGIAEWRNGFRTASWEHITRLYEIDDQEDDYRLFQKLKQAHKHMQGI